MFHSHLSYPNYTWIPPFVLDNATRALAGWLQSTGLQVVTGCPPAPLPSSCAGSAPQSAPPSPPHARMGTHAHRHTQIAESCKLHRVVRSRCWTCLAGQARSGTPNSCLAAPAAACCAGRVWGHLQGKGYSYVNLDDCIVVGRDPETSELIPDPAAFPLGVPSLAAALHEANFTLGWCVPPLCWRVGVLACRCVSGLLFKCVGVFLRPCMSSVKLPVVVTATGVSPAVVPPLPAPSSGIPTVASRHARVTREG
jgi:hypothetical protein